VAKKLKPQPKSALLRIEIPEPCEGCKTTENVTFDADPYAHDIDGDDTPVWLCDECREQRADDI
jgi:hypothetical protein